MTILPEHRHRDWLALSVRFQLPLFGLDFERPGGRQFLEVIPEYS